MRTRCVWVFLFSLFSAFFMGVMIMHKLFNQYDLRFFSCLIEVVFILSATCSGAIIGRGNVSPAHPDTWTADTQGYVGYSGLSAIGEVLVDGGSQLFSKECVLAYNTHSSGTITVAGSGSKWTNGDVMYVGYLGTGSLKIEDAGQIENTTCYLGHIGGSKGSAIVTGIGSQWINNGALCVGYFGDGMLTVTDGGIVNVQTLYAPLSNLTGDGTITTTGAVKAHS
jgi:T5SS/PEP-CTERM-associated repeat protein